MFHIEAPAITQGEIDAVVDEVSSEFELSPDPVILVDDRWFRRYINGTGRRMFGLTGEEYARSLGGHVLAAYVDPAEPLFTRYPDEERAYHLARRVLAFRLYFANQQFDSWYLAVERHLKRFEVGASAWDNQGLVVPPRFLLSQEVTYLDPQKRTYRLEGRLDILVRHPRFMLLQFRAEDEDTRRLLNSLRAGAE